MPQGPSNQEQGAAAAYEALNASYRAMDEWMRQGQHIAEQVWMPWIRPWVGTASPFIPPEQWARAYGDLAMVWMSLAQAWTSGLGMWADTQGPRPFGPSRPAPVDAMADTEAESR